MEESTKQRRLTSLTKEIAELLVSQYVHEKQNYFLYTNFRTWCGVKSLFGHEEYFEKRSKEEEKHADLIYKHLLESDWDFVIPELKTQPVNVSGNKPIDKIFSLHEAVLTREIETTELLLKLSEAAFDSGDLITHHVISTLVLEQQEEENVSRKAIDQFDYSEDILLIDKVIGELL